MTEQTPLAILIETRMTQLGIDRAVLGLRMGYRNPAKAAGRVYALCDGHITSAKSRTALQRLPEAIEVPTVVVATAVEATQSVLEERTRQQQEKLRIAREEEDAAWRAAFVPHAIIQGEQATPSPITTYALSGGAEWWLIIRLDLSQPRDTFLQQAMAVLPSKLHIGNDGRLSVPFFELGDGIRIDLSPDEAVDAVHKSV